VSNPFASRVLASFEKHRALPALRIEGGEWTYGDLLSAAEVQAGAWVRSLPPGPVGVLAARSHAGFAAILACVGAGRAYVPLHPKFPVARLATMAAAAGCAGIIAHDEALATLQELQRVLGGGWRREGGRLVHQPELDLDSGHHARGTVNGGFAYILFTSGTTGRPKGIGITPCNVCAYLDHATRTFGVQPGDRASQMFELTFDLSVHDLFVTWLGGGLLCVPPAGAVMAPARFIIDERITHWFSVPSTASILSRLRLLREGAFPSLRQSLFCGEALPSAIAAQWCGAAPGSSLTNLYGPTEATIAITAHAWAPDAGQAHAVVPIGRAFPGQRTRIVIDGCDAPPGQAGELWLGGTQVSPGYLDDPEKTAAAFVTSDDSGAVWYRTGDLVREDARGVLHFLGRLDTQVQLHGHRVELGEVEGTVRNVCGGRMCAVVPWPPRQSAVESLVAFVEGAGGAADAAALRAALGKVLPDYMVPARIVYLPALPLNANGKIDRVTLASSIP